MTRRQKREKELGRQRRRRWLALLGLIVACGVAAALAAFLLLAGGSSGQPGPPRAAIVDQLDATFPNAGFVDQATATLKAAGYEVDYYPGEETTVELYRDLPKQGYNLLILRVHSALLGQGLAGPADAPPDLLERVRSALADNVFLFTSEPYSQARYLEEQEALRLVPVRYSDQAPGYSRYFGVGADFVRSSMRGKFDQASVVLMGCDGLTFDATAAALIERGAVAVVGWSGLVSADHTDRAVERLLEHLVAQRHELGKAVEETMAEVGPDPAYGSKLLLYPLEAPASSAP